MSPLLFRRLSDETLGSRLASGEAAAFDELYRRYANRLAAYGSHLLGDAASGDDVAHAALLKAYGALRDGRTPEKMKPWLYRIAHNAAIDLVARRRELLTETLPERSAGEREPFAGALVEALATLPDRQRRVYVLREVHGLRIDETAAELGLTATQVEQSLFAARNRLAEQLVFGDRLNCVTVQRLAAGPLDASERRALKTHVRACRVCRQALGLRGRALSVFPSGAGLEWFRGLGAGLIGGGTPAAAKVGAIVATASIVGGGTVAVEQTKHRNAQPPVLQIARATPVTYEARHAPLGSAAVQVAPVGAPVHKAAEHARHLRDEERSHDSAPQEHDAQQQVDGSSTDDHRSHDEVATVTIVGEDGSSHERSGKTSERRRGETQPTETQPSESDGSPQDTSTTTETTTTEVTVPPPPDIPVIISPE